MIGERIRDVVVIHSAIHNVLVILFVPWEALFSKAPPVVYFRYTMESHMISCGITRYSTVYHVISCGISGYSTGSHMTPTGQKRS